MEEKVEFYTAEEVAEVLRLHPYTVRRLCREKKVPAFKFGGQWRFRKDDIDQWSKSYSFAHGNKKLKGGKA
ncbi:MAG: helix-turn-helix domain-containing protein [Patescibacteria group bacterium]|jgi:excisionase family DNA binding protein